MTPLEFHYAMKDYYKERQEDFKGNMEVARYVVMHLWNVQNRYVKQIITDVRKYLPFPWEQKANQTIDQMKAAIYNIAGVFKRKFDNKEK